MNNAIAFAKPRRLVIGQIILTILVFGFYVVISADIMAGLSALAGCAVALVNTVLFLISVLIASKRKEAKEGVVIAYLFAGVRFILVGILLVLGAVSGLGILPMIVGFIVLQLGQVVNLLRR